MSDSSHIHIDNIVVDSDIHFTIDANTRIISNRNGDKINQKLILTQFDNNSERYTFDIDRIIDGHDLLDCNRVRVHFINIGSNKQKNIGICPIDDVHVNENNPKKVSFSWLVSRNATLLEGVLSFLISFECVDGDKVLYRWSTTTYDGMQITAGMDNNNAVAELYVDELLTWQNEMETELLPTLVEECYIDREFATSEEVMDIFDTYDPVEDITITIDDIPTDNSQNLVRSGGVKHYTDQAVSNAVAEAKTYTDNAVSELEDKIGDLDNIQVDLSDYYTKTESNILLGNKVDKVNGKDLSSNDYTDAEKEKLAGLSNYNDSSIRQSITSLQNNKANKSEIPDISGKADKSEIPDVSEFITKSVSDLENYHTKSETYTKDEISDLLGNVKVDLDDYYTKSETYSKTESDDLLGQKVDKVSGKDLSSNDYTDADKEKLSGLKNYDDSAVQQSIVELQNGKADKSEIPDISGKVDKTELNNYVTNAALEGKGYLTSVPSEYVTETELTAKDYATNTALTDGLADKVEKVEGKGLSSNDFTNEYKQKLEGLSNYDDTKIKEDIENLNTNKANKSDIPDVSGKADKTELNNYVTNTELENKKYATKSEVSGKVSLTGDEEIQGVKTFRSVPEIFRSQNDNAFEGNQIVPARFVEARLEEEKLVPGNNIKIEGNVISADLGDGASITKLPSPVTISTLASGVYELPTGCELYMYSGASINYYNTSPATLNVQMMTEDGVEKRLFVLFAEAKNRTQKEVGTNGSFIVGKVGSASGNYHIVGTNNSYVTMSGDDIISGNKQFNNAIKYKSSLSLDTSLNDKTLVDAQWVNSVLSGKGYLTSVPSQFITDTELENRLANFTSGTQIIWEVWE